MAIGENAMNDSANSNREYYRATAALTLHYGPDTTQSREALALDQEVWSTMSSLENQARLIMEEEGVSEEEKPLLKILSWLDFKLDLVLYHLRSQEHRQYFPYQGTTSEISGSGFGMAEPCELEPGSGMLFSLILPDAPWRPVVAVGEVVRTETDGNGAPPAVRFVEISDTDRERIIRFTFKKQRQELSRRAEEERP
jgi:hypothetical protein